MRRGYRRAMVAAMTAAAAVPHFHFCDEVKMAALQRVRERLQGDPALRGARLTYMPFILKARPRHRVTSSPIANCCHASEQMTG